MIRHVLSDEEKRRAMRNAWERSKANKDTNSYGESLSANQTGCMGEETFKACYPDSVNVGGDEVLPTDWWGLKDYRLLDVLWEVKTCGQVVKDHVYTDVLLNKITYEGKGKTTDCHCFCIVSKKPDETNTVYILGFITRYEIEERKAGWSSYAVGTPGECWFIPFTELHTMEGVLPPSTGLVMNQPQRWVGGEEP